jgi:peptidyl-prolyl cis-trans isomerase A (cyclophilin A)
VIDNFMVQGGGFDASYVEKNARPGAHEGREALAKGPAQHRRHAGHGAHQRPELGQRAVLHQRGGQRLPGPDPDPARRPGAAFEYQGRVYENVPRANLVNAPQLFGYTVFGKVVSGMDVVNKMKSTPTGPGGPFPRTCPRHDPSSTPPPW